MRHTTLAYCCLLALLLVVGTSSLPAQNTDSLWAEFHNPGLYSITRIRSLHWMETNNFIGRLHIYQYRGTR